MPLCDTLLRLAEIELFEPYWSDRLLHEMTGKLADKLGLPVEKVERRARVMQEAFDSATVPADAIERLEPSMTNDEKDRHVLAAAVASGAQVVVTANLADFPTEACEPFGIEAIHPDDFLLGLFELDPDAVVAAIAGQAADLSNPPMTMEEVLDTLSRVVPNFVAAVRRHV
jgi:predicted nucleic acid-binding protein